VDVKIGVLALQGNVSEHIDAFRLALSHLGRYASYDILKTSLGVRPLQFPAVSQQPSPALLKKITFMSRSALFPVAFLQPVLVWC
jgi:hypothetical protein